MLHELLIGYDPAEDRIHVAMRSRELGVEVTHRLALTRRVCMHFLPGLQELVRRSAQVPEAMSASARQALIEGHHQAQLQQTTFQRERRQKSPAGESPARLALRAVCGTRRSDGQSVVRFEFSSGEPLAVVIGERSLHALAAGLGDRMRRAAWIDERRSALVPAIPGALPVADLH